MVYCRPVNWLIALSYRRSPLESPNPNPATTFVAEDLLQALNYQPTTNAEADLPEAAWLAAVALELRDVHDVDLQQAIDSVVENQGAVMQMRAAEFSYADVADYAANSLPV